MEPLLKLFSFGQNRATVIRERLEVALHSLHARGLLENFQPDAAQGFRLQWDRGNFGMAVRIERASRGWQLVAAPVCNPAGPFAADGVIADVLPLANWTACGPASICERVERKEHVQLVGWLATLEDGHPVIDWMNRQFARLAAGETPGGGELQAMVLLGARRFLKTIPGTDRLHDSIEPALFTLLRMSTPRPPQSPARGAELDVVAGEDHGRTLLGFLQETHPLETRRAAQRFATSA